MACSSSVALEVYLFLPSGTYPRATNKRALRFVKDPRQLLQAHVMHRFSTKVAHMVATVLKGVLAPPKNRARGHCFYRGCGGVTGVWGLWGVDLFSCLTRSTRFPPQFQKRFPNYSYAWLLKFFFWSLGRGIRFACRMSLYRPRLSLARRTSWRPSHRASIATESPSRLRAPPYCTVCSPDGCGRCHDVVLHSMVVNSCTAAAVRFSLRRLYS